MIDDTSTRFRAWIAGLGLMLLLTTALPAAQAARLLAHGYPCISTSNGGVNVEDCGTSASLANDVLGGGYPTATGSAAFPAVNATATGEDVRVAWSFNESTVDANVTAFHIERGLDPNLPDTMEHVATVGPDADTHLHEGGAISGEIWYVVTVELENGHVERSQPFRVSGIQAG